MIKNLKIVFRKIRNDRTLSILKLAGLVLAFSITIPLVCSVTYQESFDRFHPNSEKIYNVYIDETYHGTKDIYGECPLALGQYLEDLFPEVESMVRTKDNSDVLISRDNSNTFKEDVLWTDPSFTDVFYLNLFSGNKKSFLTQSNEVYISKSLSEKIFGNINSIGENIKVDGNDYTVSGIFDDYPVNSHQKFTVLLPLKSYVRQYDTYSWESYEFLTYIKFKKEVDVKPFETKIQTLISDYLVPWLKTTYNLDYVFDDENSMKIRMLPVSDIHLHGSSISSFEKESDVSVIYINLVIVLVLLLIAYFNLMGFAFSKGKKHQFQIDIKRYLGSSKKNIITSFMVENLTYTFLAFIISWGITLVVFDMNLPVLAGIANIALINYVFPVVGLLLFTVLISILCGIILGIYFSRSSLKTGSVKLTNYSTFWLNRTMLIAQMAVSIILIISITGIYRQIEFISNFNLGIDTQNTVIINQAYKIRGQFDAFKSELKKSPLIKEVSRSNSYPFNWMSTESYIRANSSDQTPYPFPYFSTDIDFQGVFSYKMIKGRWFSRELASDKNAIVLNEAAVREMGLEDPIGEEFYKSLSRSEKFKVIGVVDDFNFRSLHHKVEPLLFYPLSDNDYWRYIEIKGNTSDRKQLIAEINRVWSKVSGNDYMNYSFLDDRMTTLYANEMKTKSSIELFSLIAILISCFGLLGTVLNISNEKTKEIGIRKVNGAKVWEVLTMLNKDFVKWVMIAFVVATPIASYAMNKWLENFAYKTTLSWWIFALAGLLALGIALLTVSWQSWKAATRNPIEALRYE